MRYIIEIMGLDERGRPTILHRFAHTASSMHMVWETMKVVRASCEWPSEACSYRIISEAGDEIHSG